MRPVRRVAAAGLRGRARAPQFGLSELVAQDVETSGSDLVPLTAGLCLG